MNSEINSYIKIYNILQNLKSYIIIITEKIQKKSKKEAQNMKKAKTFAGVERERERERATTLTNNNQAKKLALLMIYSKQTM